jgi:hypothetical protein
MMSLASLKDCFFFFYEHFGFIPLLIPGRLRIREGGLFVLKTFSALGVVPLPKKDAS